MELSSGSLDIVWWESLFCYWQTVWWSPPAAVRPAPLLLLPLWSSCFNSLCFFPMFLTQDEWMVAYSILGSPEMSCLGLGGPSRWHVPSCPFCFLEAGMCKDGSTAFLPSTYEPLRWGIGREKKYPLYSEAYWKYLIGSIVIQIKI